jgi:hypothetical protein
MNDNASYYAKEASGQSSMVPLCQCANSSNSHQLVMAAAVARESTHISNQAQASHTVQQQHLNLLLALYAVGRASQALPVAL